MTHLSQRGAELERVRGAAAVQRSLVERHFALADQLERYEQQRSRLVATIQDLIGRPVPSDGKESISSELRTELKKSERAIAEITDGAVTARFVITAADQAVRLLDGDHAVCPTCMRQLLPQERASAISVHRVQQGDPQAEARRLEEARGARQTHARAADTNRPGGIESIPTSSTCSHGSLDQSITFRWSSLIGYP